MSSRRHRTRTASGLVGAAFAATLCCPAVASAQLAETNPEQALIFTPQQRPITARQRREWFVGQVAGPKNVGVGLAAGTWQTIVDSPHEWNGASGFGKRVLTQEAHTGISKGIEASLGAVWGEDPRRLRSGRDGFAGRLGFAAKTVVLAPRPDGHLGLAWGRYAGAVGSSVVENAWLPSRLTTVRGTASRVASSLLSRLAVNLWTEFGPDLRRRLTRAIGSTRGSRPHEIPGATEESVPPAPSLKF